MEIRTYTPELQLIGIVENISSLQWNRKYNTAGNFELRLPITRKNIEYFARGNIVSYLGAKEAGVVEYINIKQDSTKSSLVIKGRFLESYLDRRLIYTGNPYQKVSHTFNFTGKVEEGMRTIITNVQNVKPIPLLELGEVKGYTERVSFQATYQNLLKYESKLADSAGYGFWCMPDFNNRKIIFNVYKGLDHSESQSDRVRVIFSDGFRNLNSAEYTENDQLLKTVCYVGGQGEGAEREWVVVGDDTLTGLARREIKLDATNINPEGITQNEYLELLRQRGIDLLENKDIVVQSFECETIPQGNFKYKEHYDLGDIVTVKKEQWGLTIDLRITEIDEIYEGGKIVISPTFGNPLPEIIDWEDK